MVHLSALSDAPLMLRSLPCRPFSFWSFSCLHGSGLKYRSGVQDVAVKMMQDEGTILVTCPEQAALVYWQANEHLRPLLLHPCWPAYAYQVLLGQQRAHIWRLKLHLRSRLDDGEPSPELQALQARLEELQKLQAAAAAAAPAMLTKKQAAQELKRRKQVCKVEQCFCRLQHIKSQVRF